MSLNSNELLSLCFFFVEVIHTQGPLDGSLYAKVRKKDSIDATVTANGLPPAAAEHVLPAVDHALSVSSDSGNSTASIKTDRTDDATAAPLTSAVIQAHAPVREELSLVHQHVLPAPQPISPQEKQELEQLLSGLEGPMHRQGYLSTPTSVAGGMLHLVPAQVHVNGHGAIDRETDILDDELPTSQEGNSVDSLGTFSSTEGRATPADLYYQPEPIINGQDHIPYLERSVPEKPLETIHQQLHKSNKPVSLAHKESSPSSGNYMATQNGSLHFPHQFNAGPSSLPQAPARTTSSRDAVQRGLNIWQQFGVPEEPVTEGVTFSPPSSVAMVPSHSQSLPQFPIRHSASQQEIEQSIETLNLLMMDLGNGRGHPAATNFQSSPLSENNVVVTTQPSFTQSQTRPAYQPDGNVHANFSSVQMSPGKACVPEGFQAPESCPSERAGSSLSFQASPASVDHIYQTPANCYQSSIPPQPVEIGPAESSIAASASSHPRNGEPDEVFNVEGLVAQRVAGKMTLLH